MLYKYCNTSIAFSQTNSSENTFQFKKFHLVTNSRSSAKFHGLEYHLNVCAWI